MYRPEIDGLRAIAVLAVVLYHVGLGPPAGYVGVDVFFVISGYLITGILLRQERIDFLSFYARRMRRLVPALMLVVGATLLFSRLIVPLDRIASSAAASMMFVANIYFHQTTGGYFDSNTSQMPLLHLWSLGVEEQFYLLWPVLFAVAWRWRHRVLLPLVAGLALVSLVASELVDHQTAFYSMPTRFWELAAGGLIAIAPPLKQRLAGPGLTLLFLSLFVPFKGFPGLAALPAVAGTAFILTTLHARAPMGFVGTLLRSRPMVFTGLISYSLYLWHWPLLAFETLITIGAPSLVLRLGLAVLAGVLAWLTYRFVETPFRRDAREVPNGKVVLTSLALSAGLAAGAASPAVTYQALKGSLLDTWEAPLPQCSYHDPRETPAGLPPASCNSIPDKEPKILLWGDSHADRWRAFAWKLGESRGESVAAFTYGGCPPALNFGGPRPDCMLFNDWAVEYVKTHQLDTVILSTRLLARMQRLSTDYGDRYGRMSERTFARRRKELTTGLTRTVEVIAPLVNRVVLMGPLPQSRKDADVCQMLGQDAECAMSRREFDELSRESFTLLDGIARRHSNVEVLRSDDFFCNEHSCPITLDGKPVLSDANHLTPEAAEAFFLSYQQRSAGR